MLKVPRQIVNVNNYDSDEVALEALMLLNEADMTFNDYDIISVTNDENMSCGCRCSYWGDDTHDDKLKDYDADGMGNYYKKNVISRYIIDGGASRHMTPYANHLKELNYNIVSKVKYGNGQVGQSIGVGNLNNLYLNNVLFVPGVEFGTISVSQLTRNSVAVHYVAADEVVITISYSESIMTGTLEDDGLYYLDTEYVQEINSNSNMRYYYK